MEQSTPAAVGPGTAEASLLDIGADPWRLAERPEVELYPVSAGSACGFRATGRRSQPPVPAASVSPARSAASKA
ncbi:MAG: hypothetical protein ACXWMU_00350, partial [Candidatus Limnocylindrales bacterium]